MNVAIQPQLQTDRRDDPVLSGFCITEETSRSRTTTLEKNTKSSFRTLTSKQNSRYMRSENDFTDVF